MEDLATMLKDLRLKAGLSQQMLADRALISVQAVSALERGYRKVPYPKTLERIAEALALPADVREMLELSARRARGERLQEHEIEPPHNLPRQLTSFVGRDDVVKEVAVLAKSAPVVSIVGTGGAGKTRSAIEVASRLLGDFPDGVWLVELAPINDPELVAHALAATLGLQESPRTPLLNTLIAYLAQKQALIVLDNCEHVIDQTRRVVGSLLRDCAKVGFLTTSREALNVTGERVYRIPPLSVPERPNCRRRKRSSTAPWRSSSIACGPPMRVSRSMPRTSDRSSRSANTSMDCLLRWNLRPRGRPCFRCSRSPIAWIASSTFSRRAANIQ